MQLNATTQRAYTIFSLIIALFIGSFSRQACLTCVVQFEEITVRTNRFSPGLLIQAAWLTLLLQHTAHAGDTPPFNASYEESRLHQNVNPKFVEAWKKISAHAILINQAPAAASRLEADVIRVNQPPKRLHHEPWVAPSVFLVRKSGNAK